MFAVVPEVRRAVIGDTSVPFALARSNLQVTKRTKKSGVSYPRPANGTIMTVAVGRGVRLTLRALLAIRLTAEGDERHVEAGLAEFDGAHEVFSSIMSDVYCTRTENAPLINV